MGMDKCSLVELPKISEPHGNLIFIEGERYIGLPQTPSGKIRRMELR